MLKRERGKRKMFNAGLYSRDYKRFMIIGERLEKETGRPASASIIIQHLLDCADDLRKIDATVRTEMKGRDNE